MLLKSLQPRFFSAVRSMATEAAVPAQLHGIDGRYATALFTAAQKEKALPAVESDLKSLAQLFKQDPKVKTFLESPSLDRTKKMQGLEIIMEGKKYSPLTVNFFNLLAENGRLDQSDKVISSFDTLMTAFRGEVNVTVTSAKELDAKTLNKVRDVLAKNKLAGPNATMLISNKVDEAIIGGMIIEIGDNTIDLSVSAKITKLNSLITEAV